MTSYNGQLLSAKLASLQTELMIPKAISDEVLQEMQDQYAKLEQIAEARNKCSDFPEKAADIEALISKLEENAEAIEKNIDSLAQRAIDIKAGVDLRQ